MALLSSLTCYCCLKWVELPVDFIEILEVVGNSLRLLFGASELFKISKLVLLSCEFVHLLDPDFLYVPVLHLASHFLHSLLLLLVQFSQRLFFFFPLFALFYILGRVINLSYRVYFETYRIRL